jgi:hypothetical protein
MEKSSQIVTSKKRKIVTNRHFCLKFGKFDRALENVVVVGWDVVVWCDGDSCWLDCRGSWLESWLGRVER